MRMLVVLFVGFACGALVVGFLRPRPVWTAPSTADQLLPVEQALERPICELDLIDVPLDEAVRRIGEAAGVPAKLDLASFAGLSVQPTVRVTVRTRGLPLYLILARLRQTSGLYFLTWQAAPEGILMWCGSTPAGSTISYATVTRAYEVADIFPKLAAEDAERETVAPTASAGQSIFGSASAVPADRLLAFVNSELQTGDVVPWGETSSPGYCRYQHQKLLVTGTLAAQLHARQALAELRETPIRPRPPLAPVSSTAQFWSPSLNKWLRNDSLETEQRLSTVVSEFRFAGKQRDAIDVWAKAVGIAVTVVDPPKAITPIDHQQIIDFNELRIDLAMKGVPAYSILAHILKNSRFGWRYDETGIRIEWIEWKKSYPTCTRTYDLTQWFNARQAPSARWTEADEIAATKEVEAYLQTSIDGDALRDGLVLQGDYKVVCRRVVVTHVAQMHFRVAEVIHNLNTQPSGDPTTRPATSPPGTATE